MARDQGWMGIDLTLYQEQTFAFFENLSWHQVRCPICEDSANERYPLFSKRGMDVVRCYCGMVYSRTQPTKEALEQFYAYSNAMQGWSEFKKTDFIRESYKFESVKTFLLEEKPQTLLDLGCGNGKFLHLAQKWLPGAELYGIDPSPCAIESAIEYGVNATCESFENFDQSSSKKYEVISMWGVLEHLPNPLEILEKVRNKLVDNGYLIVCVPNVESLVVKMLWDKCFTFCPQHLWYFDIASLSHLLSSQGFQLVEEHFIESEAKPMLRASFGFAPYGDLPKWVEKKYLRPEAIEDMDKMIIQTGAGYKIVGIFQKT